MSLQDLLPTNAEARAALLLSILARCVEKLIAAKPDDPPGPAEETAGGVNLEMLARYGFIK